MGDIIPINKKKNKTNVVMFPIERIVNPINTALGSNNVPKTLDEIAEVTTNIKIRKINEVMEILMNSMSKTLTMCGITFNTNHSKHLGFAIEAIRSMLFSFFGVFHPLQDLANNIFEQDEKGKMTLKGLAVEMPPQANTEGK